MGHVSGIGGFFFRAAQPEELARWYLDTFGIDLVPGSFEIHPWRQEQGPTVFAPFPANSEYFGNLNKTWMLNLRVRDLDGLVAKLRGRQIDVTVDLKSTRTGALHVYATPKETHSSFGNRLNAISRVNLLAVCVSREESLGLRGIGKL